MGVYGGPEIVNDNLILALDGANFKSFKGEATTNEIVSVTWSGDGSNQASFTKGSQLITDESLKYKGYQTYLWSPGTSRNCYLNGADLSSSRTSTVWTFSCYVKRQDGAPITSLNVYMYYPSSDGSAAGTIEDAGNGWYRVSRTRTGTNNYLSLIGFTGFTAGYKYYLSGAQLEKKSYATTVVATNTTRGTTVATGGGWADLTGNGNHGELVNGVRESADNLGSLSFDGSNDYGSVTTGTPNTGDFTVGFIYQLTGTGGRGGLFERKPSLPYNGFSFGQGGGGNWSATVSGTSNSNNRILVNFTYPTTNTWYYDVAVYSNGNTITGYRNGNFVNSTTGVSQGNLSSQGTRTNFLIANRDNITSLPCKISQVSIYNRALTTSEIQQNFNALRGRFGI